MPTGTSSWNNLWGHKSLMNLKWQMLESWLRTALCCSSWLTAAWLATKIPSPDCPTRSLPFTSHQCCVLRAFLQHADVIIAMNINHLRATMSLAPRTTQAAAWPSELNQMVLDCIIQQAAIEEHLADEIYAGDAQRRPASGLSGRSPKRRRQGRMATISSPAPPVYVRPQGSSPASPDREEALDDVSPSSSSMSSRFSNTTFSVVRMSSSAK